MRPVSYRYFICDLYSHILCYVYQYIRVCLTWCILWKICKLKNTYIHIYKIHIYIMKLITCVIHVMIHMHLSCEAYHIWPTRYRCCSALQCVVLCCSVFQCVAVCHTNYTYDISIFIWSTHGGDNNCMSRLDGVPVNSFEWRGLRLLTRKPVWNFGDSRENVFDMYGDSCENLLTFLAVVIILSLISSVWGLSVWYSKSVYMYRDVHVNRYTYRYMWIYIW